MRPSGSVWIPKMDKTKKRRMCETDDWVAQRPSGLLGHFRAGVSKSNQQKRRSPHPIHTSSCGRLNFPSFVRKLKPSAMQICPLMLIFGLSFLPFCERRRKGRQDKEGVKGMCGQDARKACLVPKTCRHPLLSARPRKGKMNKDRKPIHQGIYFALTLLWVKEYFVLQCSAALLTTTSQQYHIFNRLGYKPYIRETVWYKLSMNVNREWRR